MKEISKLDTETRYYHQDQKALDGYAAWQPKYEVK